MVHLYPTPTAKGIAKTKEFYLNQFGRAIDDQQAFEILNPIIRYLYLINIPCSPTPSMPALLLDVNRIGSIAAGGINYERSKRLIT